MSWLLFHASGTLDSQPGRTDTGAPFTPTARASASRPVLRQLVGEWFLLLAARGQHGVASRGARINHRAAISLRAAKIARVRDRVVAYARAQKGERYGFGGQGPSTGDCSGLTRRSLAAAGVRLPRSSAQRGRRGERVPARQARIGDLVVYDGHIGILSGRWRMVDAPGRGRWVIERAVWKDSSLWFRRVIG